MDQQDQSMETRFSMCRFEFYTENHRKSDAGISHSQVPLSTSLKSYGTTNDTCPKLKRCPSQNIFQGRIPGSSNEHLETDVLGSLEKLHTLGTMRSIRCCCTALHHHHHHHHHQMQVKWKYPNVGEGSQGGEQPQHRLPLTDKLRTGG